MAPEPMDDGNPRDLLGLLVKRTHQSLTVVTDAALEPLGIDRNEFGVLRMLAAREPLSQQALAALLAIDTTTMVSLIDALQGKNTITRRPDPADRRRNAIELTATGRALCQRAEAAYANAEDQFLAPLGAPGADQFRQALQLLLK